VDTAPAAPEGLLFPELEWVRLEGLPEHCVVERAVDTASAFDVEWLDCPEGIAGCRYMRVPERPEEVLILNQHGGTFNGAEAILRFSYRVFTSAQPADQMVHFVIGAESGVRWAFRNYSSDPETVCLLGAVTMHPEVVSFTVHTTSPLRSHVFHARWDELDTIRSPWAIVDGIIQTAAVSPTTLAGETGGGPVYVIEEGRVRRIDATAEFRGIPQQMHVIGRVALWEDWPGLTGTRLVGATIDDGPFELVAPAGWDVKRTFKRTDGLVAWTQSRNRPPDGGPYEENELWTADLRGRDIVEIRRRVIDVDHVFLPLDGPGLYGDHRAVFDLDDPDGVTRYSMELPDSVRLTKLLATSPEELFYRAGVDGRFTFVRLRRDAFLTDGEIVEP
jgi:hypothetical protein